MQTLETCESGSSFKDMILIYWVILVLPKKSKYVKVNDNNEGTKREKEIESILQYYCWIKYSS